MHHNVEPRVATEMKTGTPPVRCVYTSEDADAKCPTFSDVEKAPSPVSWRKRIRCRKLVSIQTFTVLACSVVLLHTIPFTIQSSTITTMQKSYGLTTFEAGVAYCAYVIGEMVSGVFVSYFGGQRRKPRIIAIAMILTGMTCFIHASPHFLFDYNQNVADLRIEGGNHHTWDACRPYETTSVAVENSGRDLHNGSFDRCTEASYKHKSVLAVYVSATTMWGLGYGPLPILLMVYIEDNAGSKAQASFYQSVFYAVYQLSPVVGYSIAAATLSIYTDLTDVPFSLDDSRWIGAWWLGYLCCGIAILLLSLPFFFFPERISVASSCEAEGGSDSVNPLKITSGAAFPNDDEGSALALEGSDRVACQISDRESTSPVENMDAELDAADNNSEGCADDAAAAMYAKMEGAECEELLDASSPSNGDDAKQGSPGAGQESSKRAADDSKHPSAKMFLPTLWCFMKNPIYVLMTLTMCTITWVEAGFFSYLPKYLEVQFHQSASAADMEAGVSGSVMSAIAVMTGGWVISRFKLTLKQCAALLVTSAALSSVFYIGASLCTCPQYFATDMIHNNSYVCSGKDYLPVCLDKTTYFSPCHAGCQNWTAGSDKRTVYSGCLCSDKDAVGEVCADEDCNSVIPFMVLVVLADMAACFSSMARVTVLLRCVKKEHRSFSYGLASEFSNLVGWVAAPLLYGWLIDASCLTWERSASVCSTSGGTDSGSCLQYDNAGFGAKVHQLTYGAHIVGLLFSLCICLVLHFSKASSSQELHSVSQDEEGPGCAAEPESAA